MFYVLSAVGLGISIGIMVSFKAIFKATININIDTWMDVGIPLLNFFKWLALVLNSATFWLYVFSFAMKTLGGLILTASVEREFYLKINKNLFIKLFRVNA